MARDLLILGDGVHSDEMAEIVERINRAALTWNLLGYVSWKGTLPGTMRNGYPVVGSVTALDTYSDAAIVPDNEWPKSIAIPKERLVSLIDPGAFVSRTATIGRGCVLYPHCFVGLNAVVGDFVFCLSGSILNHDVVLEDRVVVASDVTLAGSVYVEQDCYLGQSCTIRQYLRIGRGSIVGMGSVIIRDVPPNSVVAGNPGRRIRSAT